MSHCCASPSFENRQLQNLSNLPGGMLAMTPLNPLICLYEVEPVCPMGQAHRNCGRHERDSEVFEFRVSRAGRAARNISFLKHNSFLKQNL